MAKKLDVRVLFERKRYWQRADYTGYRDVYEEIDAVHARKKGISVQFLHRDWLDTQHFRDVAAYAHDRDLMVVLDPHRNDGMPRHLKAINVFIVRTEEMWRIPAVRALQWVPGTEAQRSTVLGYSEKQIKAFMEYVRWCSPEGRGSVFYALLDRSARDDVEALGKKAFRDPAGLMFFACGLEMKRDAFSRVPKDLTVARFLLDHPFGWKVVGSSKRHLASTVFSGVVPKQLAPQINRELRSPIEFLARRGWG